MINSGLVALFVLLIACNQELERKYYPNGKLYFEVPLVKGHRNGQMTVYNEDGTINETSYWKDGYEDGEVVIYDNDGVVIQKQNYHRGIMIGSDFFSRNGALIERHYFDNLGRLVDYKRFKEDGRQNMDANTRKAIFIEDKDTVRVGEFYESLITLGNRRFDNIEVVLGNPLDPNVLKYPRLSKRDNKLSIVRIRADSVGLHNIDGAIIEFHPERKDSFLIVPFRHTFFVEE